VLRFVVAIFFLSSFCGGMNTPAAMRYQNRDRRAAIFLAIGNGMWAVGN
jgi:hypothetical protein